MWDHTAFIRQDLITVNKEQPSKLTDESTFVLTGDREEGEEGEVAHLIDKSSPELVDLVGVGVVLSLALGGVLSQTELYCDQANIEEDFMLPCLAAQNKLLSVFLSVWLPILLYCFVGNYKIETIPRSNTARSVLWIEIERLSYHTEIFMYFTVS